MLYKLTVDDYQDFLDGGWRRSGRFVYKPCMEETCCPLYTIRCRAKEFQPSKSQRKVLKRVNNFLLSGVKEKGYDTNNSEKESEEKIPKSGYKTSEAGQFRRRVDGLNKAKLIRAEKNLAKKSKVDKESEKLNISHNNVPKNLNDLVPESNILRLNSKTEQDFEAGSKHKFFLRLVKADLKDPDFFQSFPESFSVYQRYQQTVHKETEDECDFQTFASFLCESPLIYETRRSDGDQEVLLGSFHQHYIVDDHIVAVGVLDILPHCVSSVYFYYDPVFWSQSKLSPGTYSALREVQMTQQLTNLLPDLCYYYMGYYVHSCPKMRYKGKFVPSDLLSPSLTSWHSLTDCIPLLDESKYSSFSGTKAVESFHVDKLDISKVHILAGGIKTTIGNWNGSQKEIVWEMVCEYHQLVGQKLSEKMLLNVGETDDTDSD